MKYDKTVRKNFTKITNSLQKNYRNITKKLQKCNVYNLLNITDL